MALFEKITDYFTRKPDLHVLFVFDNGLQGYEQELPPPNDPQWPENFIYEIYDNRSFRIKYTIEHEWKEKKVVLLVKSVPPQDEASRLAFPLLDVLASNMEFKEDSPELFMQERNISHDYINYVKRNITKLQRKKNDDILKGYYKDLSFDILNRSIISAELDSRSLLDWPSIFLKLIILGRKDNTKRRDKFFNAIYQSKDSFQALQEKAQRIFGYKADSNRQFNHEEMLQFITKSLKYNSLCGNLTLAPGDNYEQFKVFGALDTINAIWDAGQKDESFTEALDEIASDINENYILKIYGAEANYFRLTPGLAYPIAKNLLKDRLWVAPTEVNDKIRSMLNNTDDNQVKATLQFLARVCDFYTARNSLKIERLNTPQDYIQTYTSDIYLLDTYYRLALELYVDFTDENPVKESLENTKKRLDNDYTKFTSDLNRNWINCFDHDCGDIQKLGFTCQNEFYSKYQKKDSKLAVIVCDAFRYEIAEELKRELLKNKKHIPSLDFAIAQLPTETKYCKTALLPHNSLEFVELPEPTIAVDGEILATLDQREKHLKKYVANAKCINYKDLEGMNQEQKRDLFKSPLVYVFYDFIDDSGHDHNAKILTKACREAINELKSFIYSLHSTINVSNVVLTSDHGFLYDFDIAEQDKQQISENNLEKKTRYYLTKSNDTVQLITKYPLSKVSGMNRNDIFVAVPSGTNRIAAPGGGYNFAHGGIALQEVIIPILRSNTTHDDDKQKVSITVLNSNLRMVSSILQIQILQKEAVSKEFKERIIKCAVFDNGILVTEEREITLNSIHEADLTKRVFEINLALNRSNTSQILELKIWDVDDPINPLYKAPVTNNTFIDRDF